MMSGGQNCPHEPGHIDGLRPTRLHEPENGLVDQLPVPARTSRPPDRVRRSPAVPLVVRLIGLEQLGVPGWWARTLVQV